MCQVITHSRFKIPTLDVFSGYPCSNNKDYRIKCSVFVNYCSPKLRKKTNFHIINYRVPGVGLLFDGHGYGIYHANLLNGSLKSVNFCNFISGVTSIEHGFVCDCGEISSIQDEEEPMWENSILGLEMGSKPNKPSKSCSGLKLGEGEMESNLGEFDHFYLVSKMGEGNLSYLEERDEETLSKRMLALSRTNKKQSAITLFRSMMYAGLRPNSHACNSLLACLSRNGMLDDLLGVFSFMKHSKIISGHSCSLVLKAMANTGDSDLALQMFSEWMGEKEMEQPFDAVVYNTMISICGKANNFVQMEKIWKSMKESGNVGTEVTYRVLVCTFVRCGQYDIAIDTYCEMLQNGVRPGCDAMQAAIGACMKENKWDMALHVFLNMLKFGLKPNLIACNALLNALGKVGKVKEAIMVYKCLIYLGHSPDSYTWNALLGAFYSANEYADALQFFESLQNNPSFQPNLNLYNTVLMCCQRLGYWDKAIQFLWHMENSGILVSTTSYNIVISACEVARKPKVALQIYKHMVHQNQPPNTFTHLSLIRSCIWADLWTKVEEILDESTHDVSVYNTAIQGMCLRRRFDLAKELYLKMRDIGLQPDGKTRALMLQYMHKT